MEKKRSIKSTAEAEKNSNRIINLCYLLIIIVSFLVYANSLFNDFVYDDPVFISNDKSITSLANIPKYFTGSEGYQKLNLPYYRPVSSALFNLNYLFSDHSPFGYHLVNIILHILSSILLFKFLLIVFNNNTNSKNSQKLIFACLTGALIFAAHPVHTEVVGWISGRVDCLTFVFFIPAFIYYLKYTESNNRSKSVLYFFLTCFFYSLSLLTKESAIIFPAAIFLFDLIIKKNHIKKIFSERLKIYLTLIIISCIYLYVRMLILKGLSGKDIYLYFYDKDAATVFFTMIQIIPLYVKLFLFPSQFIYNYNGYVPFTNSFNSPVLISIIVILLLFTGIIVFLKKAPVISYAVIFFFISILPVMNIVPTANLAAERFLYIPSISLCLIIVSVLLAIPGNVKNFYVYSLSTVIIITFGIITVFRNFDWKNNGALFLSGEGKQGTVLYTNLGNIYYKRNELNLAEQYYIKALGIKKELPLTYVSLAKVLMDQGKSDSAFIYIKKGIQVDTLLPEPRYTLAEFYSKNEMISQAIDELEKLNKISPNFMNSNTMLLELIEKQKNGLEVSNSEEISGQISKLKDESYKYYEEKNYSKAIDGLTTLIKLNPSMKSNYYNNIGMCYMDQNRFDSSKKYFELAIDADKSFSTAYNNLGMNYEKQGDLSNAKKYYQSALNYNPDNEEAGKNLERLK